MSDSVGHLLPGRRGAYPDAPSSEDALLRFFDLSRSRARFQWAR